MARMEEPLHEYRVLLDKFLNGPFEDREGYMWIESRQL
jgi:hypothetical protein